MNLRNPLARRFFCDCIILYSNAVHEPSADTMASMRTAVYRALAERHDQWSVVDHAHQIEWRPHYEPIA